MKITDCFYLAKGDILRSLADNTKQTEAYQGGIDGREVVWWYLIYLILNLNKRTKKLKKRDA
jgi:hypothetical protein